MVRFDDFHDQLDDAGGREELAALLPFRHGELAKEVFVNLAEGIALDVHRHGGEVLQQRDQKFFVEAVVRLRQNVLQVFVVGFDGLHRLVDGLADVGAFRQIQQGGEPGCFRQVKNALRLIVRLANRSPSGALAGELAFGLGELVIGVAQEDQAENRDGVLGRLQFGVRPEFIGGSPQALFEFGSVGWHGRFRRPEPVHAGPSDGTRWNRRGSHSSLESSVYLRLY